MRSLRKVLSVSIAVAALTLGSLALPSNADESITWSKELTKSLEQAKKENKYVLADIYTDWCGWCKRLDATTFADPKFAEFVNKQFICVKVNAEDKGEGTAAASENQVNGYPTALVYNSDGKVVGKIVGFKQAKPYEEALEGVIKSAK